MTDSPQKDIDVSRLQQEAATAPPTQGLSNEFVEEHLGLIQAIASNTISSGKTPPGIEFEDLVSWGVEGLIKAKQRYEEGRGSTFKTYAYYRIRGEMFDRIRKEWKYLNPGDFQKHREKIRERIADLAEAAMDEMASGGDTIDYDRKMANLVASSGVSGMLSMDFDNIQVESKSSGTEDPEKKFIDQAQPELLQAIKNMSEQEQQVVELFYFQDLKQNQIAERLNVSKSTVCRMHMSILEKLKSELKHVEATL